VTTDLDALENDPRVQAVLADPRVQAVLASGHDPRWMARRFQAELMLCPATTADLVRTTGVERAVSAEGLMGAVSGALDILAEDDEAARYRWAAGHLFTALRDHARRALADARLPSPDEAEAEARRVLDTEGAVFGADERLGVYLSSYGPAATKVAARWKQRAEERAERARMPEPPPLPFPGSADPLAGARERPGILWAGWWSGPAGIPIDPESEFRHAHPWLVFLARVLWETEVRKEVENQEANALRLKGPGLSLTITEQISNIKPSTVKNRQIVTKRDGTPSPLVLTVQTTEAVPLELVASVENAIGTVAMRRAFDWLVREAHEVYLKQGRVDPIEVVGGWAELARRVGSNSKQTADKLHQCFDVFVRTTIRWEGPTGSGHSNLANYSLTPHAPGRPAVLRITPGEALAPGVVSRLSPHDRGRTLVPWLPCPPLEGLNTQLHARAAQLEVLVRCELAIRVREYTEHQGVRLPWTDLATKVDLHAQHIPTLQELWKERYQEVSPGRWWFAVTEETKGARALLEERAALVEGGRKRGKASAARKRGRLAGKGK
jgi:hypothetical protein